LSAIGLKRPPSWPRIVYIALAAAALRIALGFIIEAVCANFWPPIREPAGTAELAGNIKTLLIALVLIWTFAAFGEEIVYRGYLTTRAADIGSGSLAAYWIATVLVSVLFGYGHYYKGPTGVLDSGVAGLILGASYLAAGRNLWAPVLAHGLIDTVAATGAFLGLDI
jgi:membrane protease YdiL (CAAX protease family)